MDTSELHQIGETVAVDGVHVTVAFPEDGPATRQDGHSTKLGEMDLRGYTGVWPRTFAVALHNTSDSPMPLPDPDDVSAQAVYARDAAIENHYTRGGETWTSFLRLLAERTVLHPDERVAGLLSCEYPVMPASMDLQDVASFDPLEVTVTPPESQRETTVRFDPDPPDESAAESTALISLTGPAEPTPDPDARMSVDPEAFPSFCSECGTSLNPDDRPNYCSQCGAQIA